VHHAHLPTESSIEAIFKLLQDLSMRKFSTICCFSLEYKEAP